MITKTITLYEYDELPTDKAKEKAREWYVSGGDVIDLEFTLDNFRDVCGRLGVTLNKVGNPKRDDIHYSIGGNADQATFSGNFRPRKDAVAEITKEFGAQNETLVSLAEAVESFGKSFPGVDVVLSGSRSFKVSVEVYEIETGDEATIHSATHQAETLIKSLQNWLLTALREDYEYQHSEENVSENIRINNYTFREDGRRENA